MKGFNIAPQPSTTTAPLPPVAEFIASLQHHHEGAPHHHELFGSTLSGIFNSTPRKMHQRSSTVSSSQGSINEGHHHLKGFGRLDLYIFFFILKYFTFGLELLFQLRMRSNER